MLQLRRICDTGSGLPWAISGFERPAKASIYKAQHWERPVLGTADGSCLCVHLASLLSELPTGLHAAAAAQQAGRLLCTSGQVSCNNVLQRQTGPSSGTVATRGCNSRQAALHPVQIHWKVGASSSTLPSRPRSTWRVQEKTLFGKKIREDTSRHPKPMSHPKPAKTQS